MRGPVQWSSQARSIAVCLLSEVRDNAKVNYTVVFDDPMDRLTVEGGFDSPKMNEEWSRGSERSLASGRLKRVDYWMDRDAMEDSYDSKRVCGL